MSQALEIARNFCWHISTILCANYIGSPDDDAFKVVDFLSYFESCNSSFDR